MPFLEGTTRLPYSQAVVPRLSSFWGLRWTLRASEVARVSLTAPSYHVFISLPIMVL